MKKNFETELWLSLVHMHIYIYIYIYIYACVCVCVWTGDLLTMGQTKLQLSCTKLSKA